MPEQITKHPDVTLQVLKSAGARCGEDAPQKILTQCPAERFCALPGGEMCIFGLADIPKMTQIAPQELAAVVCTPADAAQAALIPGAAGAALLFVFGAVFGFVARRRLQNP